MGQKTCLYQQHCDAGARIVDFSGWSMPVNYGSQIEEHHAVRRSVGMFDVSHMTIVDVEGERARDYLRYLLANDVDKLQHKGKALYSAMLNADGCVLDDLIVYRMDDECESYRLVVNCGTREKDLAWMREQNADFGTEITERDELAMLAIQGPEARRRLADELDYIRGETVLFLKPFECRVSASWTISTTGYTGEDGLEIILPADEAVDLWQALAEAGVPPCGLGARDTLRLEAGMNLYGQDMDESVTPLESNMAWTVAWEPAERDFIGRAALQKQRDAGDIRRLVGLVLEERGVLRSHQSIVLPGSDEAAGEVTSGSFSPTLQRSIGLARVPASCGDSCEVEIRGKLLPARVVKPCFVRAGKPTLEL